MGGDTSAVKKKHDLIQWQIRVNGNTKYGKRREGRWTPIRAKTQNTRANPNSWETHLVRKRWDIAHYSTEGARWSSGIDAAIGARGRGSRPVYYLTVQRPWTSRQPLNVCSLDKRLSGC